MRFVEFIGQDRLLADLKKAVASDRVGHAYLFLGPAGSGRQTLARLLAQALLCEAAADRPCETCRSCLLAKAGTHPDLQVVQADGATVKIEQMRAVRAQVAHKPLLGKHRVYLLAEMERMTEAAANSFLLTLEDPPPGVVFIGWAAAGAPLLPTIVSRCQVAKVQPLPTPALASALRVRGADEEAAFAIATAARGLPGLALHMLAAEAGHAEDLDELLGDLLDPDPVELLRKAEALARVERETIGRRLTDLGRVLDEAIIAQTTGGAPADARLAALAPAAIWRLRLRTAQALEFLQANANMRLLLDVLVLAFYQERTCSG